MKFLVFVLIGFVLCAGASESEKRQHIVFVDGENYVLNDDGELESAGLVVIGEQSLKGACLAGKTFDQTKVEYGVDSEYDADKEDFYYTITNNAPATAVISITTADQSGMFCSTPFRTLDSGECLRVYEDNRLQSLASVRINGETLCDGWTDKDRKKCIMGRNYEIKTNNLVEIDGGEYFSTNFNMTAVSALDRTDCKQ